jgi:Lamin Tail Domain/Periplasmic copper-binding protein (NosD)
MTAFPMSSAAALAALTLAGCAQLPSTDLPADGHTWLVAPGEGGEWDDEAAKAWTCGSVIQTCIDAASSGDTVNVSSGTYVEDLTMKEGVAVVGAGLDETWVVGTVTFDGLTTSSLSKLSVYSAGYYSTGTAYLDDGIVVTAGDAQIASVGAYYFRYGIYAEGAGDVTVDAARLGRNWYGIYASVVDDLQFTNGFVFSNPAGGIATDYVAAGDIVNNTVLGNAFSGSSHYLSGAISLGRSGAEKVYNNIIVSNYYGLNCYSCTSSWGYNLIWGNTTDYVNDASAASTNLSVDPLFADAGEGDYSLSVSSPCIDAGSTTRGASTDVDGETRPQGSATDIGFDEYATTDYDLIITEVMANAKTETTGEFVEIYNNGSSSVDLAGLVLTDGDDSDALVAYGSSSTVLAAGAYAVVLDADYAGEYTIDSGVVTLTTGDTNLGNGLTTSDKVTLYESDESTVVAQFSHPKDPGDGVSMELVDLATGDASGNWRASQCSAGSSPGATHCFPDSGDPSDLIITEVLANASVEATGEYIELYNSSADADIDLAGLVIMDTAYTDTLQAFQSGSTLLAPGQHALIVDAGYSYDYILPNGVILVTTGDSTLGNGLSTSDTVSLFDTDGTTLIDSFSSPSDPGDGYSIEKVDYAVGDEAANWADATDSCAHGSSPGRLNGAASGVCGRLIVTEVLANAADEDTEEFVELYNYGVDDIDLAGLVISDGDQDDTLQAYGGGSSILPAGGYAVVLDSEYDGASLGIDSAAILVTTLDTHIGNALSTSDEVVLYEADGSTIIDAFYFPSNPGDGISIERVALYGVLDSASNWSASTCASAASPGADNCVSGGSTGTSVSTADLIITEVMANALDEDTGEFIEIYNNGSSAVDLLGFVLYDGDAVDTIEGYSSYYDTVLEPGAYAVIVDSEYAGEYSIPSGTLLLVNDDTTVGSGLATNDPIYLFEGDASSLVDSFTSTSDPGNGTSLEKDDITGADTSTNWSGSTCSSGSSPGETNCVGAR